MGKLLIIKNADFSGVAVEQVTPISGVFIKATASPNGGGIVTGSGMYQPGDVATLEASASEGYAFVKWSDGETSATREVNVGDISMHFVAEFEEVSEITITTFDTSKVMNAKYAGGSNHGLFYLNSSQNQYALLQVSYIIPYKLVAGSTVKIKIKSNAPSDASNLACVTHWFKDLELGVDTPLTLTDARWSNTYQQIQKGGTQTVTVPTGYPYLELYLQNRETYNPEDIYNAIDYIEIVRDLE